MWNNQGGFDQGGGYGGTGGGYINSPGFGSPQQSQEKRSRQRAQNVIPCSVAQILKAEQTDEAFMLDMIPLHQVTIVGLVRTVTEHATRLEYHIDDMTGPPIQVRQFIETDENTPEEDRTIPMRENTYVRVFGNIRSFQNQRSLVAFKITPILDMNELTTHLLEVVHSHLWWTKSQSGGGGGGQVAGYTPAGGVEGGYAGAQAEPMMGLNRTHSQVELAIRNCLNEQGISIQQISEHLRGIPQSAIREAVEFLSSEGHIYSTIDDEHYKSTESGD